MARITVVAYTAGMTSFRALTVAVSALWLVACGGDVPSSAEVWCDNHRCDFVDLAFDQLAPEGHGGLESALRTLNAASGLELVQDTMGIPIRWEPAVFGHDGEPACGITEIVRSGVTKEILTIEITIASEWLDGCKPDWMVIRHEIACHALTGGFGHIETGMCSPWASDTAEVDQPSLDWMCAGMGGC